MSINEESQSLLGTPKPAEWWERPRDAKRGEYDLDLSVEKGHGPGTGLDGSAQPAEEAQLLGFVSEDQEIGTLAPAEHHEAKLGELASTAISGNDITSSVLYVSGVAGSTCGIYGPIATGLVALVLALFRPIYTEVVTALPMNGGAYNVLLNTTSKKVAGVAAALTILSYVATAVVSAFSAMQYLKELWPGNPLIISTILLLFGFAVLNFFGISESAVVAVVLFVVHCVTLIVLIGFCTVEFIRVGFTVFEANLHVPPPQDLSPFALIFLGYSSAMLGITGFETSANFVEQQTVGVFPKTLRNMWIAVAFFNPVISFLSFAILDANIVQDPNSSAVLLSLMGQKSAGAWLRIWVSVDAVLVLSGAVLTSYVGVTGLLRRLALDRILFQFLLAENKLRHTNHWIIFGFFAVASSLFLIVGTDTDTLGGVYTTAFLCVMALFSVGNMLLKYKRSKLPREVIAPWPVVIMAFLSVFLGFIGNLLNNFDVFKVFLLYFIATLLVIVIMFLRVTLLKIVLYFCKKLFKKYPGVQNSVARQIQLVNETKMVFFAKSDSIAAINKALLYVLQNEQTNWVQIVHVYQQREQIPPRLQQNVQMLDEAYPKMRIDLVLVRGEFGPTMIEKLQHRLHVPKNFMFITCPGETFNHKVADLGGVRLVTH
jgi:amino acid transporter